MQSEESYSKIILGLDTYFFIHHEAKMELTKFELEVMNVVWNADRPLAKSEIAKLCTNKSWKDSYTHLLITGLLKKGALKETDVVKVGRAWASAYEANISCEEYYADNVFADSSAEVLPMIFHALIRSDKITPELIDELEKMLEERRGDMI